MEIDFDNKETAFEYNDDIIFRLCSLSDGKKLTKFGTCTNFDEQSTRYETTYTCNQYGVHLYCKIHPTIELEYHYENGVEPFLECPKCKKIIKIIKYESIYNIRDLYKDCLKKLNYVKMNADNIVRLEDWYYPEKNNKIKNVSSGYWISSSIKRDKDGATMIVLYIGNNSEEYKGKKSQFFIQPEKLKLTHDHKDLDPATIISEIKVTLKDRTLEEKYDED